MSTLQPRAPYSSEELAALYPAHLHLQLVQVLLRHGERTPVSARFTSAGLAPYWPYCSAARHLRAAVLDPDTSAWSTLEWKRRLETFGPRDAPEVAAGPASSSSSSSSSSHHNVDDICDFGQLTDRGRETTYDLGRRLRRLYVDQLGFLPPAVIATDFLYLRSTPIPRALESLQQALHGLYPPHTRAANLPPPTILSRAVADETLFPNDSNCRRFAVLARAFARRAADRWNDTEDMAYLTKKLGRWMPEDSPRVAVDSRPRLNGIMDTINATAAHGPETRLPSDFYDPKVKAILEKIGVDEWFTGYKESQEYRTLGIGGLLADVVSRMVTSVEQTITNGRYEQMPKSGHPSPEPVRFGLSGCHDTTLAGALASLGAFEGDAWPPFTSHVAIELFRRDDDSSPTKPSPPGWGSWLKGLSSGGRVGRGDSAISRKLTPEMTEAEKRKLQGYFVRIRYNDKPVSIPGCKPPGKHLEGDESFCTLEAFKEIVDKFTPENWKQQCRANLDAPEFPSKPEPSGY
ncbi:putative acid phosphatase [Stachybotrys elegans]|uniref:3-phytase n=1 Tax=Stachybotrys elegans TaxID=80388 RepID=A0A8K0WP20_9HYPO|nr:putative acid phosphatase [Stachybotrys elegans]